MQYILNQEEFDELKKARKIEYGLSEKKLQALCTKICNEMPVKFWGREEAEPWRCMITVEKEAKKTGEYGEWYCDQCPVQEICPYKWKSYSK